MSSYHDFSSIMMGAYRSLAYAVPNSAFLALAGTLPGRRGVSEPVENWTLLSATGEMMTATHAKTFAGDEIGRGDTIVATSYPDLSDSLHFPSYDFTLIRRNAVLVGTATYVFDRDFEELRVLGRFGAGIDEGDPALGHLRKSLIDYRIIEAGMPDDAYAAWLVKHGWPNSTPS